QRPVRRLRQRRASLQRTGQQKTFAIGGYLGSRPCRSYWPTSAGVHPPKLVIKRNTPPPSFPTLLSSNHWWLTNPPPSHSPRVCITTPGSEITLLRRAWRPTSSS